MSPPGKHKLRRILYAVSLVGMWGIFSVPPLFSEDPTRFQAAGSLVVAYAIVVLVTRRYRYENTLATAQEIAITTALNRLEAFRRISDQRSNNTADLHTLQLVQISDHIGVPCPFGPQTPEELHALGEEVERRLQGDPFPPPEEETAFIKAVEQLSESRKSLEPWVSTIWRLEVVLLVLGTLQWGYGDTWHPVIWSLLEDLGQISARFLPTA